MNSFGKVKYHLFWKKQNWRNYHSRTLSKKSWEEKYWIYTFHQKGIHQIYDWSDIYYWYLNYSGRQNWYGGRLTALFFAFLMRVRSHRDLSYSPLKCNKSYFKLRIKMALISYVWSIVLSAYLKWYLS